MKRRHIIDATDFTKDRVSSNVHLHMERTGGHLSYIHNDYTPMGSNRWMDCALVESVKLMAE